MKYKVGDKVLITSSYIDDNRNFWRGKIMTINFIFGDSYFMEEDWSKLFWLDSMIEKKVEEKEEQSSDYYLFKYLSAKLSEKEAELNAKLSEIKKIQEEIKKVLDNESEM